MGLHVENGRLIVYTVKYSRNIIEGRVAMTKDYYINTTLQLIDEHQDNIITEDELIYELQSLTNDYRGLTD